MLEGKGSPQEGEVIVEHWWQERVVVVVVVVLMVVVGAVSFSASVRDRMDKIRGGKKFIVLQNYTD